MRGPWQRAAPPPTVSRRSRVRLSAGASKPCKPHQKTPCKPCKPRLQTLQALQTSPENPTRKPCTARKPVTRKPCKGGVCRGGLQGLQAATTRKPRLKTLQTPPPPENPANRPENPSTRAAKGERPRPVWPRGIAETPQVPRKQERHGVGGCSGTVENRGRGGGGEPARGRQSGQAEWRGWQSGRGLLWRYMPCRAWSLGGRGRTAVHTTATAQHGCVA